MTKELKREDVAVPESSCPSCGHKMDCATHPSDITIRPGPGDISVCIKCAEVLVFDPDMKLRLSTLQERNACGPDLERIVRAIIQLK